MAGQLSSHLILQNNHAFTTGFEQKIEAGKHRQNPAASNDRNQNSLTAMLLIIEPRQPA